MYFLKEKSEYNLFGRRWGRFSGGCEVYVELIEVENLLSAVVLFILLFNLVLGNLLNVAVQ